MAPFSFKERRKVFNGAIVCNFAIQGPNSPKNVTCNIRIRTIECKKTEKSSKVVPKRMQSCNHSEGHEATKVVPKGAQSKF
jgi:hypothetical protein